MARPSGFVYIVDRYLEVSNVYHQRMASTSEDSNLADRIDRLLDLVEGANPKPGATPLKEIPTGFAKGKTVAPTSEFLEDTQRYQQDVLRRLSNKSIAVPTPRNLKRLSAVLALNARDFLGSFPTPTYAWDILTELASISVCPDARSLAARDMIHMHAVELQLHLARVIAQVRLSSPQHEVPVRGSYQVKHLRRLLDEGSLVERLIEFAVPRDPSRLLEELSPLVQSPEEACEWLEVNQQFVLKRLLQETRAFPETLEDSEALEQAPIVCDKLVTYGLIAAYSAWYSRAIEVPEEAGSFRTSMLFSTRILLDEGRWTVCSEFASIALAAVRALNRACAVADQTQGTGMLTANTFFARRMCGESLSEIKDEILAWNTDDLSLRYKFLQHILLDDFDAAAEMALNLLRTREDWGRPDLCIHELREWPILAAFRGSEPGQRVLNAVE